MNNQVIYRNHQHDKQSIMVDAKSGSEFWSIEGKRVQFTWFDVPAHKNFEKHKHDSEQITYILEGELFFRSGNTVYKLTQGDCILIPANTEHEVWTEEESAKAVDAWSPVNKMFSANKSSIKKYSHEK